MIVHIVERAGAEQQALRRATIDPSRPREDYALLGSRSDRLERLPASGESSALQSTARRCRAHYVTGDELEPPDRELLRRTQKAVDTVLDSGVYADGLLDQAAVKAELAEKEWAIATDLRTLSEFRASREKAVPGRPLTEEAKDRLRARMRAEGAADGPIRALVGTLESYADHVEYADAVYEDLQDREAVAGREEQFRGLIAGLSAQREQAAGITDLKRQANAVFDALCELDERTACR